MKTVKHILDKKGPEVWSIGADAPVFEAIRLMAEKEVGALMVKDGERIVGIVSERDYARKVILKGRSSKETRTEEIMTTRVVYVNPERTIEECVALMTNKGIRHLPVLDEGELMGMLSSRDLLGAIIAEQQYEIEQLERYITG